MAIDANTEKALKLSELALPASPPVTMVTPEEYVDSGGENALRISVVLPDDVDEAMLTGDAVIAIKAAIRDSLIKHGVKTFPYVFFVKVADRAGAPPEEGDV